MEKLTKKSNQVNLKAQLYFFYNGLKTFSIIKIILSIKYVHKLKENNPMSIKEYLAKQLEMPTGIFGRLITGSLLNKANENIIECTIRLLQLKPNEKVLDIGFGGGISIKKMLNVKNIRIISGVEISAPMINRAKKKFKKEIKKGLVELKKASVENLPYESGFFDKVCTVNTLYFWKDPIQCLKEIKRVMRSGGRLVLSIRSKEKLEQLFFVKDNFTLYDPEDAQIVVEQAGFKIGRIDHRDKNMKIDSVMITAES